MILKTITENNSMLDLVKNVKTNIEFYLKHREELADLKWTNDELLLYIKKLNTVIDMYDKNLVQDWFKNYNAYLFMSSRFPYIVPYMSFCFSFKDFVDILLLIGCKYNDGNKEYIFKEVEYINSSTIIPIFVSVDNNNIIKNERYDKYGWLKLMNKIN